VNSPAGGVAIGVDGAACTIRGVRRSYGVAGAEGSASRALGALPPARPLLPNIARGRVAEAEGSAEAAARA